MHIVTRVNARKSTLYGDVFLAGVQMIMGIDYNSNTFSQM